MSDQQHPPSGGQNDDSKTTALEKPKGPLGTLSDMLQKYKEQIEIAVPRHLTAERMIRIALTAVSRSELLQKCNPATIAGCVVQSSLLGLECDGALGEAYLVPFWNHKVKNRDGKKVGGYECQFMIGYQGLIKLVRNTDELIMIDAQEVREKDHFEFELGLDPYLRHKIDPKLEDRGEVTHYWAAATLKGGGRQFAVMTKHEIEEHRDKYSKGAFETEWSNEAKAKVFKLDKEGKKILQGPWKDSPEWMFKKTVLRKLCKLLPKSAQAQLAVQLDETNEAGVPQRFTVDVPIELHQTGADDDETDVAEQMRQNTASGAADLRDRLENQQTNGGESAAKKSAGKREKKEKKEAAPAPAEEGSDGPTTDQPTETSTTAAAPRQPAAAPEEYPAFQGDPQAKTAKDMPPAEKITQAFTLAKEAGVKPSKEAGRMYGINPDELSIEAMDHFLGYLNWLIQKKHSGETVAASV